MQMNNTLSLKLLKCFITGISSCYTYMPFYKNLLHPYNAFWSDEETSKRIAPLLRWKNLHWTEPFCYEFHNYKSSYSQYIYVSFLFTKYDFVAKTSYTSFKVGKVSLLPIRILSIRIKFIRWLRIGFVRCLLRSIIFDDTATASLPILYWLWWNYFFFE